MPTARRRRVTTPGVPGRRYRTLAHEAREDRRSLKRPSPPMAAAEEDIAEGDLTAQPLPAQVMIPVRSAKSNRDVNLHHALARLGRSPEDQARWLLRLAYGGRENVTAKKLLSVQEEIGAFLSLDPMDSKFPGRNLGEPVPRDAAEACIAALRDGLGELARRGAWPVSLPRMIRVASWPHHHLKSKAIPTSDVLGRALPIRWRTLAPFVLTWANKKRRIATMGVNWRGYFLMRVYDVLRAVEGRFRLCPKCRRAFIAHKRQGYCTPRCSQAVRTQRYRSSNRDKVNAQRRTAYERAMKKAYGGNVKVRRHHRS